MKLFSFLAAFAATAVASNTFLDQIEGVGAGTVLRPHHPPGHDPTDVFHLLPKLTHTLHYRGEGSTENDGSAYGHMVSNFLHPTVILDHSSHVSTVGCSDKGLNICFASGLPLSDVSELWKLADTSPLIFSSFFPGCGETDAGIRSYWKATGITLSQDGCVHVAAAEVPIEEAMSDTELEWGSVAMDVTSPNNRRGINSVLLDDPKVDISDDPDALSDFFGIDIDEPLPDGEEDELGELDKNGSDNQKRGIQKREFFLVSWGKTIANKAEAAWNSGVDWVKDKANQVVHFVVDTGNKIGKAISDAAGHEWSISSSDEWKWKIGQPETVRKDVKTNRALFGVGDGLVISETGGIGTVSCEKCGASGTLTARGAIAFSFTKGLTKGSVGVGGSFDATLQLAVKIEAQHKVPKFEKKLIGYNPTPFQIPGVLSLGPELTLNAALDIYYNGEAEFLVGATMNIKPGEASLDLLSKDGNGVKGFDTKFDPIAKYRGSKASVTADFGLPIGLQFGVDLFKGKFKKTIGVFDQPSIKVAAETGVDGCDGIDVNVAIVNYIYLSALELYDYAIRTDELAKFDIGCITATEPRQSNRLLEPHPSMRKFSSLRNDDPDAVAAVNSTFGNNTISTKPPVLDPVDAGAVDASPEGVSFKTIMDLDETVIMVSGKEDRVYLAPAGEKESDVGAPFACFPDVTENIVISDVYGGFLNYIPEEMESNGVANLRSSRLTGVPVGSRSITLSEVYADEGDDQVGMYMAADLRDQNIFALAACRVDNKGSRIYLVDLARDDPIDRLNRNELRDTVVGGDVQECQSVFLTSNTHGLTIG